MDDDIDNTITIKNIQLVFYRGQVLTMDEYMRFLMVKNMGVKMDKKIKKIKSKVKKDAATEEKELDQLTKMDKKRDKICDYGKEQMKKRKKK